MGAVSWKDDNPMKMACMHEGRHIAFCSSENKIKITVAFASKYVRVQSWHFVVWNQTVFLTGFDVQDFKPIIDASYRFTQAYILVVYIHVVWPQIYAHKTFDMFCWKMSGNILLLILNIIYSKCLEIYLCHCMSLTLTP